MIFLHKIIILLSDIEHIYFSSYPQKRKFKLFFDYIRLRIKASLNRWFHFQHEHFLDYHIYVPDYNTFLAIFRQVFIRDTYYFQTKKSAPEIIDCGGNIGMSVLYFAHLYPRANITVFEPSREVINVLKKNIAMNGLKHVRIIHAAVGAENSDVEIYPRGMAACGNTLISAIANTSTKNTTSPYKVKMLRLSPYIIAPIDLLKLDIEGSEGVVIKDLTELKKLHFIEVILMEYHYYPQVASNNLPDLLANLKNCEFGIQIYSEDVQSTTDPFALFDNGSYALSIRAINFNPKKS